MGPTDSRVEPAPVAPVAVRHEPPVSRRWLVVFPVLALLLIAAPVVLSRFIDQPEPVDRVVTIPRGTAERVARGEDVDIIPADLRFRQRDHLIVINHDVTDHQVGPLRVAAGDRLETTFAAASTVSGYCSLHPAGRVTIEIAGDS